MQDIFTAKGLGIREDSIRDMLDMTSIRGYLANHPLYFIHADILPLADSLDEEGLTFCKVIFETDQSGLLIYRSDGMYNHMVLYPPSFPWEWTAEMCYTEEAAKNLLVQLFRPFIEERFSDEAIRDCVEMIDLKYLA